MLASPTGFEPVLSVTVLKGRFRAIEMVLFLLS
jgi:hypothetical protein